MVIKMEQRKKIGVIGGGASGMMAAITSARQGAEVTIIEGNDRIGKKILVTGNGKCNLGNLHLQGNQYFTGNEKFLASALEQFDAMDTIRFFQGLGVVIREKNGYLYPACEQAAVVLDALRIELKTLQVHVLTDHKVRKLQKNSKGIEIVTDLESIIFDCVILACGGLAAPKTGSDGSGFLLAKSLGHSVVPTVPALVQIKCKENYFKSISGIRTDAKISVICNGECLTQERGELQITDYGVSGIPIFQLSRIINYELLKKKKIELVIDFFPDYSKEDFALLCSTRKLLQEGRNLEEYLTGLLHKKLVLLFIKLAGYKPNDFADEIASLDEIYKLCREWRVEVLGSNSYDNAQVCAGGVDLREITENMESKLCPGVYFAGEIMDVDGKCGGYNLQWAWTSGYLAGMAVAGYPVIKE